MRLRLNTNASRARRALPGGALSACLAGGVLGLGAAAGSLLGLLLLPACAASAGAEAGPQPRVERRLGLMGTWLTLEVEAADRAAALRASEAALRALEQAEQRLSTWGETSELAQLNRAPVGEDFELSAQLAAELATAREWWLRTEGAFDPAVGRLVAAWGLRAGGRVPTQTELVAARVEGGLGALRLDGRRARRTVASLALEEGGFGKGAGLDAALDALAREGASRAFIDLGGQVAVLGARRRPYPWGVADPTARERVVLRLALARGSLATTGSSERGIVVDGQRLGHVLDPRSGRPASDFGSLTVHAADATAADCLSTGLYVLGPERALAFARAAADVDVLVLEPTPRGGLRARATGALAAALEVVDPRVELERLPDQRTRSTATRSTATRSTASSSDGAGGPAFPAFPASPATTTTILR